MNNTTTAPEVDGLKARLKATWTAGDYDRFSRYMEQGAHLLRTTRCSRGMPAARRGLRLGME
jgi:hypothetical protein